MYQQYMFRAPEFTVEPITGEQLREVCTKCKKTAKGLDGWSASALALLSPRAYSHIADLLNMIEDGRIRFQPYDIGGTAIMDRTFSFGRAVPEGNETDVTADARRDGLLLEDATLDQSAEIMVSNTLPTVRLIGSKQVTTVGDHTEPVCPVIDVQDGNEISRFAVYDDGFVVQKGHRDIAPSTLNTGHFSSVVAGDESLYVGSCRISYDRAAKALMFRRLKEAVPVYLAQKGVTQAPNGHTLASMTVHGWVAYAREHQSNERLTVHDVLPPSNAYWD